MTNRQIRQTALNQRIVRTIRNPSSSRSLSPEQEAGWVNHGWDDFDTVQRQLDEAEDSEVTRGEGEQMSLDLDAHASLRRCALKLLSQSVAAAC
ncbi:hypothetical protein [Chitinimonas sp. BJB300]|uniref:hypothetical protein n=1 Tax=Chitinimonas sp. BJB300 TaxID=1559339 RepID=UPI0011129C03|nr:hypothetical protein [Chitinimonas sp. BJB300]TSJ88039.1 hypothetical protein FG002_010905 [Chitinimonas sp. BJB300]